MKKPMTHDGEIVSLKRIEGQIRGIQKMIDDKRYCVDILTQLHSIVGAILRVEDNILQRHLDGCVAQALKGRSEMEKHNKIDEIMVLLKRFRRSG
ncbi:metal-sensitive transcriptional regulator [Candidatus Omnitrophota bacterium]